MWDIFQGDCKDILKQLPDDSVDLIMTSPPYADSRQHTYGGIKPDQYVDWFLPIAQELRRVLKPTGTFILNIKEKVVKQERHPYVLHLILALKEQGWLWTEEYIWHKKTCYPGKWPNRFRDAWERLLQFNKQRYFKMYQESVMVPASINTQKRVLHLNLKDKDKQFSQTNSGFGRKVANWYGREKVYPTNVLYMTPEFRNKNHSAVFPETIPEWFIHLFTQPGDTVLDPFMGSGTTIKVAQRLNRDAIGIDIIPEYVVRVRNSLNMDERVGLIP